MKFHHVLRQYGHCAELWLDTIHNSNRCYKFSYRQHYVFGLNADFAIRQAMRESGANNFVAFEYFVRKS